MYRVELELVNGTQIFKINNLEDLYNLLQTFPEYITLTLKKELKR